jgi:hypothetical protein
MCWIVVWRGVEERYPSFGEAYDRFEELESRGIEARIDEIVNGERLHILP